MHGELKIHDAVIMFADALESWKEKTAAMYIYVDDVNNIYHLALKKGAKNLQAPEKKNTDTPQDLKIPLQTSGLLLKPGKNNEDKDQRQ